MWKKSMIYITYEVSKYFFSSILNFLKSSVDWRHISNSFQYLRPTYKKDFWHLTRQISETGVYVAGYLNVSCDAIYVYV